MQADGRVREDIGKAAVMRGPVVYCMEEADNGKNLHLCSLAADPAPEAKAEEKLGQRMVTVTTKGKRLVMQPEDCLLYTSNPCRVLRAITEEDRKYYFKDREFDVDDYKPE